MVVHHQKAREIGAASSPSAKSGIFSRISTYAKKVAGILGFVAVTGVASTAPAPVLAAPTPSLSLNGRGMPMAPAPERPVPNRNTQFWDREWKSVTVKGIGAADFAKTAFGTSEWNLLVDEEGRQLRDPTKLRFGNRYLIAANQEDAKTIARAIGIFNGSLAREGSASQTAKAAAKTPKLPVGVESAIDPESFISTAEKFIGRKYGYGHGNRDEDTKIDCSRLVLRSLWDSGTASKGFNTTASGLYHMSAKLKQKDVSRGNAVFLRDKTGGIGHIAIALAPVDEKGYLEILDASSSTKAVTKRKLHVSSGFLAGALPFVSADSSATLVARVNETTKPIVVAQAPVEKPTSAVVAKVQPKPAVETPTVRETPEPVVIAMAAAPKTVMEVPVQAAVETKTVALPKTPAPSIVAAPKKVAARVAKPIATERPIRAASERSENIVRVSFESRTADPVKVSPVLERAMQTVEGESSNVIRTSFGAEPKAKAADTVSERTSAKVIDLVSRADTQKFSQAEAEALRTGVEKLAKQNIDEQISYFASLSEAANDPSVSGYARAMKVKLEVVKLKGQQNLLESNIAYWEGREKQGDSEATSRLKTLRDGARAIRSKVGSIIAANDEVFFSAARKAA